MSHTCPSRRLKTFLLIRRIFESEMGYRFLTICVSSGVNLPRLPTIPTSVCTDSTPITKGKVVHHFALLNLHIAMESILEGKSLFLSSALLLWSHWPAVQPWVLKCPKIRYWLHLMCMCVCLCVSVCV